MIKARKGVLKHEFRDHPKPERRPGARPILESGDAVKTVYLSKAPPSYKHDDLDRALERHMKDMRRELQFHGKNVVKTTKVLWGEGDVRVIMHWEVYGTKNTKRARRAKLGLNVPNGNVGDAPSNQPRPSQLQEDTQPL